MEKDSLSKPSVAELAGRFKGHILPMPSTNDELSFRRRPPCSLKLHNPKEENDESDKPVVSPNPFKVKMRNSSFIERLQANLALSPTALLPSPKSPEVKLPPAAPSSPTPPCSPRSPTPWPSRQSSEEEEAIGFDGPPEGRPLPSFNKTRARLSFKRRPPTRQHRRSAGDEAGAYGSSLSPSELSCPKENGDEERVFDSPAVDAECGRPGSREEDVDDGDRDCEKTKDRVAESRRDDEGGPEEEQEAQGQSSEALEEEQQQRPSEPCPAEQVEGDDVNSEEAMAH